MKSDKILPRIANATTREEGMALLHLAVRSAGAGPPASEIVDYLEITPEMTEVGEDVILGAVGGADLGGLFSPSDLAGRVFAAMWKARPTMRTAPHTRSAPNR